MDNFLSKLKILIGFYQVTHGFLDVFSYIEWPDTLQVVSKYSGLLQINFLQIAPIHCLFQEFHMDAFGDMFVILSINAIAIVGAGVIYGVRKIFILRNQELNEEERSSKISQTKVLIYRNVFFSSTWPTWVPVRKQPVFYRLPARNCAKITKKSCVTSTWKYITA